MNPGFSKRMDSKKKNIKNKRSRVPELLVSKRVAKGPIRNRDKKEKLIEQPIEQKQQCLETNKTFNFQDKIKILEKAQKNQIRFSEISDYISLLDDHFMRKSLLESIFDILVDVDVKISTESDTLSVDEWYAVESSISTPITDDRCKQFRDIVQSFVNAFFMLQKFIEQNEIPNIFLIFEKYVFNSGTRYMQFLIFNFEPESVLVYFFKSIKENHPLSEQLIEIVASYIVMRNIDDITLQKSIDCYYKIIKGCKQHFLYLSGIQYFLYIIYSRQQFFNKYSSILEDILQKEAKFLNKNIVNLFCQKFGFKKIKFFIESNISRIEQFYYDFPNITLIKQKYENQFKVN